MLDELVQNILKMHNDARRHALGVQRPPLIWDVELEEAAESYANVLAGKGGGLKHNLHDSSNRDQGENIYWEARTVSEAELYHRAISYWCSEISLYQGQNINLEDLGKWGHYTQIIWPSTTRVGMASAKTKSGATYIVARYSNRGNIIGQSAYGTAYNTGIRPANDSSGVGHGLFTLSPSRTYETHREELTPAQIYPSYQPTRAHPGTNSRLGSHGNVSDVRSRQPLTGAGDAAAKERTILPRARSYQPMTGKNIQGQRGPTTSIPNVHHNKVPTPVDPPEVRNRNKVENIKDLFKGIEESIRRSSPRKWFGK